MQAAAPRMNARRACREVSFNAMPLVQMDQPLPPGLYIVATPIGNLGDITSRATETLRRVDYILAEDKRVSAKLLAHIGAKAPMTAYHDHSDENLRLKIIIDLTSKAVALVSDAGTPLISDPGYKLVRAARSAGRAIYTMPGPCAAIAALTLAGLPTDRFMFLGFLPAKPKARMGTISEMAYFRATLLIYESRRIEQDPPQAVTTGLPWRPTPGAAKGAACRGVRDLGGP